MSTTSLSLDWETVLDMPHAVTPGGLLLRIARIHQSDNSECLVLQLFTTQSGWECLASITCAEAEQSASKLQRIKDYAHYLYIRRLDGLVIPPRVFGGGPGLPKL